MIDRRQFLGSLALTSLLRGATSAHAPHFAPKAKRVIYLLQSGGPSQMDLFDYKPQAATSRRARTARLRPHGPADHRHDLRAEDASRSRRRSSSSRSTARPAHGSANCCRTPRRSSTTSPSSARCTPRRSTTTRPSPSSRPARSSPAGRAWARGSPTAWAARTRTCRRSSS